METDRNREGREYGAYLRYRDAARYAGISRTSLWRRIKRGDIEAYTVGSAVLIPRADLDRYIREHAYGPDRD